MIFETHKHTPTDTVDLIVLEEEEKQFIQNKFGFMILLYLFIFIKSMLVIQFLYSMLALLAFLLT